jgi:Holliday junction resolvase RusA-like endonuclease
MKIKQILKIEVYGEPKPQGSKNGFIRGGRVVMVEASKDLGTWRQTIAYQTRIEVEKQNWEKMDKTQTAHVTILFHFVKPPTVKRDRHTVKPDLDKLIRSVLDAITQSNAVWQDDSQVVSLFVAKEYGSKNKAVIEIAHGA